MSDAQRFWTGERRMAVFWTVLLGLAGGVAGSFLVDRGSLLGPLFRGAALGGGFGSTVAIFAFIFPKAQDDPPRWGRWGVASLTLGLLAGAAVAFMLKAGLRIGRE